MPLSDLSESTQNYLKTIWAISEWSGDQATTSVIAARTGNRLSSVSDALKRLSSAGLVDYHPYQPVQLTESGRYYAVQMVRRHRLIETFLVQVLGYTWDQVHDEAESLEHAVSDFMVDRMDSVLGHPVRDPHGDPIPTPTGEVGVPTMLTLAVVSPAEGTRLVVERISDDDPALLRRFAEIKLTPGVILSYSAGGFTLSGGQSLELSAEDAAAVFVRAL